MFWGNDTKCKVCLMEKGEHTRECYYEMYINSGKLDYKEMFENG